MSGGRRGGKRRTHGRRDEGAGWVVRMEVRGKRADPRKRAAISPSLFLPRRGSEERGWIKASTRGGNKERTKKVEEVGGGGWVPWSALIGSTWSDEKFNHPPILTRSNALSLPPSPPPPPPLLDHLYLLFALSFSVSRVIRNVPPFLAARIPTR